MKLYCKMAFVVLSILSFIPLNAQEYWIERNKNSISTTQRSAMKLPGKYSVFELRMNALKSLVADSPLRGNNTINEGIENAYRYECEAMTMCLERK